MCMDLRGSVCVHACVSVMAFGVEEVLAPSSKRRTLGSATEVWLEVEKETAFLQIHSASLTLSLSLSPFCSLENVMSLFHVPTTSLPTSRPLCLLAYPLNNVFSASSQKPRFTVKTDQKKDPQAKGHPPHMHSRMRSRTINPPTKTPPPTPTQDTARVPSGPPSEPRPYPSPHHNPHAGPPPPP